MFLPTTEPLPAITPPVIPGTITEAARGDDANDRKYQAEPSRAETVTSAASGIRKQSRCRMTPIWRFISALRPTSAQNKTPKCRSDAVSSALVSTICDRITGSALIVWDTLGAGLPEIIYENALAHELRKEGLAVCQQEAVPVYYDYMIVGDYMADLLVEKTIMVELRGIDRNSSSHLVECRNYLKATGLDLCLLVTFGTSRLTMRRVVNGA